MIPVTIKLRDRTMTRKTWRALHRIVRLTWRVTEPVAINAMNDLTIYGTAILRSGAQFVGELELERVAPADMRMPIDKVCPWCGVKHWERSIACASCRRGE